MIDWDALLLAPCEQIFGEGDDQHPTPIQYAPKVGTPFPVNGVFDRAFLSLVIDPTAAGGVGMNTVAPVLGVRAAWFPVPPAQGAKLTIPSVGFTYVVANAEPDGHGWVLLRLNKVSG